jgi:hypothetical protein
MLDSRFSIPDSPNFFLFGNSRHGINPDGATSLRPGDAMSSENRQSNVLAWSLLVVLGGGLLTVLLSYSPPVDISVEGHRID